MRRLLAVLLLFSFFCQGFAAVRQTVALERAEAFQVTHAEMHLEGMVHHHDEHGLAHLDESPESIRHMLADAGAGTAALLHSPQLLLQVLGSPAPAVSVQSAGPSPCLDGLRRPPRLIS